MQHTNTVIIGGGQAGLAMSRCLLERGVDHVVLERGRVGERWRSERWDSLRLLTPNWQSRLPHWHYEGNDPDGYMTTKEFIEHLERYARSFDAPIRTGTTVRAVERVGRESYRVTTDRGVWAARNVVIATGHCDVPWVPPLASGLADDVLQMVPSNYRNPGQLPAGNVLVVGASASGVQLAEELADAGRKVTLAVGRHTRLPRRYRGRDILWWIDTMGGFMAPADPAEEAKSPAPQLVGAPDNRSIEVGLLQERGVRLTGKVIAAEGYRVRLDDDLAEVIKAADDQLAATLAKIDEYVTSIGLDDEVGPKEAVRPTRLLPPPTQIDLRAENIKTVLWATGYRRSYPWLEVPVLDERGEIRHEGGITAEPGLYVLGLRFQRRKNSNFIDGVGNDAAELTQHLVERRRDRAA
ncbi:MAG: NAD(P)-binding domain-containing protein [Acidobacteriota bacterium]|nr:MAG: NAD(P)-binding domain-containing protein [Acidobacteriota bacterium]